MNRTFDLLSRFYALLDSHIFPGIVRYATHPLVILGTILLLVPLVVFANLTAFVLLGNTYLNICSAAVSSIVLMQSLKHHAEHKQAINDLHAKLDAALTRQPLPLPRKRDKTR